MSVDQVESLLSADKPVYSLDQEVPNGRGGMEAMSGQLWDPFCLDTADPVIHQLMTEQILSVLDTLTEREAGVIALLIDGEEKTLDAIGQVYGVTRERIRHTETKTMKKLRQWSTAPGCCGSGTGGAEEAGHQGVRGKRVTAGIGQRHDVALEAALDHGKLALDRNGLVIAGHLPA